MKKTNFTSFTSRVGQCMQWVLSGFLVFMLTTVSWAQILGPNCHDLNSAVGVAPAGVPLFGNADLAHAFVYEFTAGGVNNVVDYTPLTITITNTYGGRVPFYVDGVYQPTGQFSPSNGGDLISVNGCQYLGSYLKVTLNNNVGSCWSKWTFKQGDGPIVVGRFKEAWCFNIPSPEAWPLPDANVVVPCGGWYDGPHFVADWVEPYDCDATLNGMMENDTAKIIYREWEAFDKLGRRGVGYDTIIVWRIPPIQAALPGGGMNTGTMPVYCPAADTVYCGIGKVGPYAFLQEKWLDDDGIDCDTLCFVNWDPKTQTFTVNEDFLDPKCGIYVHVDAWKFTSGECSDAWKVTVEIKQPCYGAKVPTPMGCAPWDMTLITEKQPGYYTCEFWVYDIDTVPPYAEWKTDDYENVVKATDPYPIDADCDGDYDDVVIVPASTHDCGAHTYLPPVCVYDDWSGIKQVKTIVPGVGTFVYAPEGEECDFEDPWYQTGDCYAYHSPVKLPKTDWPIPIIVEVMDSCHMQYYDTCYIWVKDRTKPVAVADKGVTVSLSDKKVWVNAETFDEGSWDNCGINMILARRSDWYDACIDLCYNVAEGDDCDHPEEDLEKAYTPVWYGEHHDTLWCAELEDDKHCDPVEAHYQKQLDWWYNDNLPCGKLMYNAWQYDLIKYATKHCVDHPYEVDNEYIRHLILECLKDPVYNDLTHKFHYEPPHLKHVCPVDPLVGVPGTASNPFAGLSDSDLEAIVDNWEQIGGGWSDAVPFSCEDACSPVTVELLVMDYWCNWSRAWTDVWVEDKTPIHVVKDVIDNEISCKSYRDRRYDDPKGGIHPVSVEQIVELAKTGDEDAYDALDAIFGGYCKAWVDIHGNYVDENWEVIDCDIEFSDSTCQCSTWKEQERVYDEHLGYLWKDVWYDSCWFEEQEVPFQKGIVTVNCAENVYCAQDVWCEFDHCGQGYLFRKFKIWQGCPPHPGSQAAHIPDTIYRHQKIWVGNNCELEKAMFDVPYDMTVYSCGVEYDPDGSGNVVGIAGPEYTGYPTFKDVFDNDCRIVGIAHEDQVFKVVSGDEACYKIVRKWYFADWCKGKPADANWHKKDRFVDFKCEQKILVIDTLPPVCTITGPTEDGGTVEAAGCYYNLAATVSVTDLCGLIEYYWELLDITKTDDIITVAYGSGDLNNEEADFFDVEVDDLGPGTYKLKARVRDECQNESYCTYTVTVVANKKPTPICITSLTAELTPMDLDQDGVVDTAMATIWAYEFDQSSYAPCDESDSELEFYIEFLDGDGDDTLDTEVDLDSLNLGCTDIGPNQVRLWVRGEGGTYDYCDVMLMVQNNMGGCGDISSGNSNITGLIRTELDQNVEQVNVKAELEDGSVLNWLTTASGAYNFATGLGVKVTVTPTKDVEDINGVSTLDLVKIQKHILGKSLLGTNLREVAADANADGKVSTLDLIEIRKLILGKTDAFGNVDSWRFFDKMNSQESYVIDPIENPMVINWTGVKIGDVDMSSDPSRSANRSGKALAFNVNDVQMVAGNTYRVDFKASNFEDITGYQFTMNFDRNALNVLTVESGAISLNDNNFGMNRLSEGVVTTSWNAAEGITVGTDDVLFTVVFEVNDNVTLSDALTLNSRITSAEAYNSTDQLHDVSLNFNNGGLNEASFALYQNEPNPFKDVTSIGFSLPEAMSATVTVYDVTGKLVKVIEGEYTKGYNSFTLKKTDINNTGVLYYQLDTEAFTATKKMIVIE